MGVPSDVLATQLGGIGLGNPNGRARTRIVPTTTGGPNLLLGPPPAGFTRRISADPITEGGVRGQNPIGGTTVNVDLLINTDIISQAASIGADGSFSSEIAIYLSPSDSLFMTYTTGATLMNWVISYTDFPDTELAMFNAAMIVGDTLLVPAPPAGKLHVLDGIGENGAGYNIVNFGGNTPLVFSKINGVQVVGRFGAMGLNSTNSQSIGPGMAADDVTGTLEANADATGARAIGGYWVIDAIS